MTNKRNIITLLIMLSLSLAIYANGNGEKNQFSSQLKIKDGVMTIDNFSVIRKSSLGRDYFEIVSTTDKKYLVEPFTVSDTYAESLLNNSSYDGEITNTELSSIKNVSFTENDLLRIFKDSVGIEYSNANQKQGFYLINVNYPSSSYEVVLDVFPSVSITLESYYDVDALESSLETNPEYLSYFKRQILNSGTFVPTDNNPFPLADIDNSYSFKLQRNNDYLTKVDEKYNIGYFDAIYNYSYNNQEVLGQSLIQKFLYIYFNNNKPLFHHYINEYMDDQDENFNYHEYSLLDENDGKELVNKALTYLTWGIEHTVEENVRSLVSGDNIYPSQIVNNNSEVKAWLQSSDSIDRENNYLPYDPEPVVEVVNSNDVTYSNDQILELQALAGEYFQAGSSQLVGIGLTTPFTTNTDTVVGTALPYVEGGMDSPRTFNFKMLQQYQIISDYLEDGNDSYKPWYGKEENGWTINNHYFSLKGDGSDMSPLDFYFYNNNFPTIEHKPFVPGYDRKDDYQYMNLAGVDSLGLLSGALAMTSFYDEILALPNRQKFIDLDNYYSMSQDEGNPSSPFLQNNGTPNFRRTSFNETYKDNYENLRFNRLDIERSTVIVPNLKDMQPGDLLVNTKEGKTEVAIVVDSGYTEGDPYFHLSNVLVLAVNSIDGRVALATWADGATYSSFTDRPKDFIVRRLIKSSESNIENPTEFTEDDDWDPFSAPVGNLRTRLTYNNNLNYDRWIPNTGEMFIIDSIKVELDGNDLGEHLAYGNSTIPALISGLTDAHYSTEEAINGLEAAGNNIYINRGDGFEFYSINKVDDTYNYIKLATFNINTNSQSAQDRYLISYNSEIFNEDGSPKDGFDLVYNGRNIQFSYNDGAVTTPMFGIRPLETNIRPGDDITLNLELYLNNEFVSAPGIDENSISVYDKKMLWRANLYIRETSNDWNDIYPWNAPSTGDVKGSYDMSDDYSVSFKEFISGTAELTVDTDAFVFYGNNEWNKIHDGTTAFNLISDLLPGNGKQVIEISDYLNIRGKEESADDKLITDKVAYSYPDRTTVDINSDDWDPAGHMDSPFDFNKKLIKQSVIQSKWYNSEGKKYKKSKDEWPQNITTASDFESKEVFEEYVFDLEEDADYTTQKIDGIFHPKKTTGWYKYVTENGQNNVYLPGLGLYYLDNHNHAHIDVQDGDNIVISTTASNSQIEAGTDCIGFAQRTASYYSNTYDWPDLPDGYAESGNIINDNSNRSYPYLQESPSGAYSWKITGHNERVGLNNYLNLDKVKPGDIFFYTWNTSGVYDSDEGGGRHIAVVSEIIYDNNMDTNINSINLIESSYNSEEKAYILKEYNINRYSNLNRYWFVVRVKN